MPIPDYVPYTSDEYQPDAPATALHFARWFQNWEAGFGGAAGAPRLLAGAMPDFLAGDVELLNVAGSGVEVTISSTADLPVFSFYPVKAATWRLKVDMIRDGVGSANPRTRIIKNGSTLTTLTQTAGSWAEFTADFSAAPGDLVVFAVGVVSGTSRYRNLRICADQRGIFRL